VTLVAGQKPVQVSGAKHQHAIGDFFADVRIDRSA
jgi:hypothetical protein